MATWSSIPESTTRKAVEESRNHRLIKGRRYADPVKWGDEKLAELAPCLACPTNTLESNSIRYLFV
jgi:hypothetical protein